MSLKQVIGKPSIEELTKEGENEEKEAVSPEEEESQALKALDNSEVSSSESEWDKEDQVDGTETQSSLSTAPCHGEDVDGSEMVTEPNSNVQSPQRQEAGAEDSEDGEEGEDGNSGESGSAAESASTMTPPAPSAYERQRQEMLKQNQEMLAELNISSSVMETPKKKAGPARKRRRSMSISPEFVRRSKRNRKEVKFFSKEDYSNRGMLNKRLQESQKMKNLSLSLDVLDRTLINKLAAECYIKTKKIHSQEMQKVSRGLDANLDSKKQKKNLKQIQKAKELYERQWMPKGSICKLNWTLEVYDKAREETTNEAANSEVYVKEERVELGEQIFDESYTTSLLANAGPKTQPEASEPKVVDLVDEADSNPQQEVCETTPVASTAASKKRLQKRYSLIQQKDFYAVLIHRSAAQRSREHYYSIERELAPTNEIEAGNIYDLKSSIQEAIIESDVITPDTADETDAAELAEPEPLSDAEDQPASVTTKYKIAGLVYWKVPMLVPPGEYVIEFGSTELGQFAFTEPFIVTEAFGVEDTSDTGVWCMCGAYKATGDCKLWVQCSMCRSWQHWTCYERKSKREQIKAATQRMQACKKELSRLERTMKGLVPNADSNVEQDGIKGSSFLGSSRLPANDPLHVNLVMLQLVDNAVAEHARWQLAQKHRLLKKKRQELRDAETNLKLAEYLYRELEINGHREQHRIPDAFHCWMCRDYSAESDWENLELSQLIRLIRIINKASGGYKKKIEKVVDGEGQVKTQGKDYSTPMHTVCYLGTLLADPNAKCIDLGAGEGRLSTTLPAGSIAIEKRFERYRKGKHKIPRLKWLNGDVLTFDFCREHRGRYDTVVCNPDFEVAFSFIVVGLFLLKRTDDSKLYFLLPSDFFEASGLRSRIYRLLPFRIKEEHKLGHLCYLEETNPTGQKLSCDSLFVLERGRDRKYEHRVINARLAGML